MIEWAKKMIKRLRRFITYGICGVINTLADYLVSFVAYDLLGVAASVSQVLGFLVGSVCGYFLNSNVTFKEGKGRTRAQFVQYVGIDVVLAALSGLAMDYLEQRGINFYVIKIGITAVTVVIHYTTYKFLVFRIRKEDSPDD